MNWDQCPRLDSRELSQTHPLVWPVTLDDATLFRLQCLHHASVKLFTDQTRPYAAAAQSRSIARVRLAANSKHNLNRLHKSLCAIS